MRYLVSFIAAFCLYSYALASRIPEQPRCAVRAKVISCGPKEFKPPTYACYSKRTQCNIELLEPAQLVRRGYNGSGCAWKAGKVISGVDIQAKPGEVIEGTVEYCGDEYSNGFRFQPGPPTEKQKEYWAAREEIDLLSKYVNAPPPPCCDHPEPYYNEVVARGRRMTMLLIKALDHPSPAELEKQTAFIFMLGQIGDPRAYEALRDDFIRQEGHRWRGTISLGACLTLDKVEDYVALALGDETGGALRALKETTGQDFGRDGKAWGDYLKVKGNLDSFRAKCRQYSVPILG